LLFSLNASAQERYAIIPEPQTLEPASGQFIISPETRLVATDATLVAALWPLRLQVSRHARKSHSVINVTKDASIVSDEGYVLDIKPERVEIRARTAAGVFYAEQSFLQLLDSGSAVPCVHIVDAPRFAYRGVMLDVARHYMPPAFLYKLVDLLSMQKMNRLHLHLTDSQGWRFQSISYPRLTEIGAYRKGDPLHTTYDYGSRPEDTLYGGFYTQDQLRDLVSYAAARFVTIIPEIEMPAHSMSALASYPGLACLDSAGKPYPFPSDIQNEYCTRDSVFIFLDTLLSEVMRVFPGTYIHIGGDEASKADWKVCPIDRARISEEKLSGVDGLQSYFIRRIERFVNSQGRQIIGWDEILEGGLAPNAAVMSWRGEEGGIAAARQHHKVVMTPGDYCYLDHYQSDAPGEPVAFGGLTTLSKAYSYNPVPSVLTPEEAKYIEGVQGNLWTEYVPTTAKAEYMIFPRATALAEVGWTEPARKDFPDFTRRLSVYLRRLDGLNVNYSRHVFELKARTAQDASGGITVSLEGAFGNPIHYTLDGATPTLASPVYAGPIPIMRDARLIAAVISGGVVLDRISKQFILHKAVGKAATLLFPPDAAYNRGGNNAWLNGVLGSDEQFSDDEWLGWNGVDFSGTIDFGRPETLHSLRIRFFHQPSSWIWAPSRVTIQTSDDGIHFYTVGETEVSTAGDSLTRTVFINLNSGTSRYLKIAAKNKGSIPPGYPGEGEKAWLFVDEAVVE
jgi:hexosaminidase